MRINYFTKILHSLLLALISIAGYSKTTVSTLKCEYQINPVGIGVAQPRLSWQIVTTENNFIQQAYEIRVADNQGNLSGTKKLLWGTGKVNSSESVSITYEGTAVKSKQRVWWQVRIWDAKNKATAWSEPAYWEMGLLAEADWKANWIRLGTEKDNLVSRPAHYFRKEFSLGKKVKSARVYVTALGLYELHINGKKVGNDLFSPGWTSYKNRIQYQTYEVTTMLTTKNTIGAIVGDGWYRGNIGFNGQRSYYGDKSALLAQLEVTYTDGTSETITTDTNWKAITGPILESDIYNGELYDARLELNGWDLAGYADSNWGMAAKYDFTKSTLIAPQGVPVQAIQEIKPVKLIKTPKGESVLDMGQNMVGVVRLKVNGKSGDKVVVKFAEVLDKAGNFYTDNLRAAKCTDTYILKGGGEEVYQPLFTFHGFRFVKLEGLASEPTLDQVTGVVIHSAMKPTGSFACSDSLINQLQHNIQWGQKGNFVDVPTDCPQRDERLGWTGDAQVFSQTAAFNFDVAAFYTKWMKDFTADQLKSGRVPHVIPDVLSGGGGATAWADASVIVPWTVYQVYGDKRILAEQYNSMKAWVEYMHTRAGEKNLWVGDEHYGDWLAFATTSSSYPGATTEKDLIATAYYAHSSKILSQIATILGKTEDAAFYANLSSAVKKAFIDEFVTKNGRVVSHTQTGYSLALAFDLLPENLKKSSAEYLAADVKKMGHLTSGFVGTPLVCQTLTSIGRDDLSFMLLKRTKYPSWLYPVTQGATTIWERWDGQKPDGSFQNAGMNSFNHYAYGAIGEWLYKHVAGIDLDPQHPGYKHILMAPHPGGDLTKASAELSSLYGTIKSAWKLDKAQFDYDVTIPANTTATITLPHADLAKVTLNQLPISGSKICKATQDNNCTTIELGSGTYHFTYDSDQFLPKK
ncbi:MAG: glycoside hydrolase family 78 protein [Prolixibacteraceae bacterium]|nr:glycoside hydrolase family 78 protein [Prolixibacteraceae bacterium]